MWHCVTPVLECHILFEWPLTMSFNILFKKKSIQLLDSLRDKEPAVQHQQRLGQLQRRHWSRLLRREGWQTRVSQHLPNRLWHQVKNQKCVIGRNWGEILFIKPGVNFTNLKVQSENASTVSLLHWQSFFYAIQFHQQNYSQLNQYTRLAKLITFERKYRVPPNLTDLSIKVPRVNV